MTARIDTRAGALLVAVALGLFSPLALGQASANSVLTFDGVDDLVTVTNHPLLELTDGTLELWFRPDWVPGSIAYDPALIAERLGSRLTRFSLHVDRNLAGVALANGNSVSVVPYLFNHGEWYHLALVEVGATAQTFVNGQFIGTTTNGFGTLIGLPLHLGSDGVGQFFRGQMGEVRLWNAGRTGDDIRFNLSRALVGTEPGLVAYWRCNEGLGTTATDATANRLNGTLYGPAWSTSDVTLVNSAGSFFTALDLTASRNTYVEVAPKPSLNLVNRLTFEAWIKPRTAQCNTVLSRGEGGNLAHTDYIFQVGTDGTNCGVMKVAVMLAGQWSTSTSSIALNVWTHVAVTWDGTTVRFYVNGLLDRAVPGVGSVYQSGLPLFLGRQGSVCNCNFFDGALDEVRVWSIARSAAEIQTNLSRTLTGTEPSLTAYWRFDEGAGIRAFDASGGGNHGTFVNRPVRVVSFWAPVLTLTGANPQAHECHATFADPGATVSGPAVALATGPNHGLAVRPDGTIAAWGHQNRTNVPALATNVVAAAVSYTHSLALKPEGGVLGWGENYSGEVNIPPSATNVVAIAAGHQFSLALNAEGTVLAWGSNNYGNTNIPPDALNIVDIVATSHSLALKADGTVVGWGANDYGQINIPANAINVVAVAAGGGHSLALKADGTVLAWGLGLNGELNVPPSAINVIQIAAGDGFSLALRANGTLVGWGSNGSGQLNIPPAATNVIAISAGGFNCLALKADGTMLAWGTFNWGLPTVPADLNRLRLPVVVRSSVNPDVPGAYALNYIATCAAGGVTTATRAVMVTDTTQPMLILTGANPLSLDVGTPFVDPGAMATDSCAGNLTTSIVRGGTVNPTQPGSYTLTYTVSDSTGNTASTNRTVLVRGWPSVLGFTAFFSGTNVVTGSPVVQFLADVNPNGLPAVAFAQYGLTTDYPGRTAPVSLPASYEISTFFATLDGLMPGATYHFRVAASNGLGVTYGPDETFTVPAPAPGDVNGDGRVDPGELDCVLSNYWPYSPWLAMTNPASPGGGLFQFTLTNAGGWAFSVLVSTNLVDWSLLAAPAWPVWQFLDAAATNEPHRFYRLRWP